MQRSGKTPIITAIILLCCGTGLQSASINIGTASADISPKLPVALEGQFNLRIAYTAETPLTANVIVLESINENRQTDIAAMVSCDILQIPATLLKKVRNEVHKRLPEFDQSKIFMNAIHTHTAPVLENDLNSAFRYPIPKDGVTQVDEYNNFLVKQVADAIIKAWQSRKPGSVAWGLGHAAIAYNRRAVYSKPLESSDYFANGTAQMYGNTNSPLFINLEGSEDHDINTLFFWNAEGKIIAMAIDVPCPAQEVESLSVVNADYWYPVREKLKSEYGSDLCVVGWIGAAGDLSPHPIYRKSAEERMINLRHLTHLQEIARRIVNAVDETYITIKDDRHSDVQFVHKVESMDLPMRRVTEKEYEFAKAVADTCALKIAADPDKAVDLLAMLAWNEGVIKRFENQLSERDTKHNVELHILRIGDIVICTNEFELFSDYGLRMQARSNALQTFIVQLAGDGSYLPTGKAVAGGGYSAIIQSDIVSPAGGQLMVDKTVEIINSMFP
jgi:hypothetical protein